MSKDLTHLIATAKNVAHFLSTCSRHAVGCVIEDSNGDILSSGHNGVDEDTETCLSKTIKGSLTHSKHRKWSQANEVHAEIRAINKLREGIDPSGLVLACTHFPCKDCAAAIVAANIKHVVYATDWDNEGLNGRHILESNQVKITQIKEDQMRYTLVSRDAATKRFDSGHEVVLVPSGVSPFSGIAVAISHKLFPNKTLVECISYYKDTYIRGRSSSKSSVKCYVAY